MPTRSPAAAPFAGFLAGVPIPSVRQMTPIRAAASLGVSTLVFVPIGLALDGLASTAARAA